MGALKRKPTKKLKAVQNFEIRCLNFSRIKAVTYKSWAALLSQASTRFVTIYTCYKDRQSQQPNIFLYFYYSMFSCKKLSQTGN